MPHVRSISLAALIGCALSLSAAAHAGAPSATPAGQAAAPSAAGKKQKMRDPNEVICRKEPVLGSRLDTQRICMTRSEWAEANRVNRGALERAQVQRGTSTQ